MFGSSAAKHETKADTSFRDAQRILSNAVAAADAKKCKAAVMGLAHGTEFYGSGLTHWTEAGGITTKVMSDARALKGMAESRIIKNCLDPSTLSGLAKRRRSRKAKKR